MREHSFIFFKFNFNKNVYCKLQLPYLCLSHSKAKRNEVGIHLHYSVQNCFFCFFFCSFRCIENLNAFGFCNSNSINNSILFVSGFLFHFVVRFSCLFLFGALRGKYSFWILCSISVQRGTGDAISFLWCDLVVVDSHHNALQLRRKRWRPSK